MGTRREGTSGPPGWLGRRPPFPFSESIAGVYSDEVQTGDSLSIEVALEPEFERRDGT
jgi:hypothetical protein